MEIFYAGTGIFAALLAINIGYKYMVSTVPYKLFLVGCAAVFWTFYAAAQLFQ